MGDSLEQGKIAGEKIRTFIGLFRNSSTEIVTATLAVLFFSAATVVLGNEFVRAVLAPSALEPLRIGCYAISGFLALWTGFRIWKPAIPPELPPQQTRPATIKILAEKSTSDEDIGVFHE
jgi:hypothetical protein